MSQIDLILSRLDKVRQTGANRWTARCPAHDDRGPSLSIRDDGGKILLHCFAECAPASVVEAIGLQLSDLFPEPLERVAPGRKPIPARDILDCIALEAKIVYLVGQDILQDKPISAIDWERLKIAVRRLDSAMEEAHG